jgi:hypothetical protein
MNAVQSRLKQFCASLGGSAVHALTSVGVASV